MKKLDKIYKKIIDIKDYNPSEEVNKIFSELVNYALNNNIKLSDFNKVEQIQKICAKAEYYLELHWSNLISNDVCKLEDFVYFDNYSKLTSLEWNTLSGCTHYKKHKVAFVGSGPLPITGIILAREYGLDVDMIDISSEAVTVSNKLISKLGLSKKINIIKSDATKFSDYNKYDVIYLAALAGTDNKTKKRIIKKINAGSKKGTHILLRSSFEGREILYKPVNKKDLKKFELVMEVRPYNDIVNSFLIIRK